MNDLKFIFVGDPHAKHINPRSRLDNYCEAFFDKMKWIHDAAEKFSADAIILSGDVFTDPPSSTPYSLTNRLIETFQAMPCPVVSTPGNHDMLYRRMNDLESTPFGCLVKSGALVQVDTNQQWSVSSEDNSITFRVNGREYIVKEDLSFLKTLPETEQNTVECMVVHFNMGLRNEIIFDSQFFAYKQLSKENKVPLDFVHVGHIHAYDGLHNIGDTVFMRLGALMRGSIATEDVNRIPRIAVLRISWNAFDKCDSMIAANGRELFYRIREIKLPVQPATEVFNLEAHQEMKEERKNISNFIKELKNIKAEDISPESFLKGIEMTTEVRETVLHYLQEAEN